MQNPHIFRMPDLDTCIDKRGAGYVFFHKMKEHSNKIIQIDGITAEEDTYKSFWQRCVRTAIVMQEKGIKANDIISICSENHLNAAVPYFAAMFLGAYAVCLHPYSSAETNIFLTQQAKVAPKILFVTSNVLDFAKAVVEKASCEIVVFDCTTEYTPFQAFLQPSVAENDFQPYEADSYESIAILQFSSGFSGLPKLACMSHRAFFGQIQIYLNCNNYYDRIMMFTTLNWMTSVTHYGIALMSGSLRIVVPKYDSTKLFDQIHLYKPTLLMLSRYNSQLINPAEKNSIDITSVKSVGIVGSGVNKELLRRMKDIFVTAKVWICYGTTETAMLMYPHTKTAKDLELFESKELSCGTPLVGRDYKVVNPETEEILGPGKFGELRVKSQYTASYFYNADSSGVFDYKGWFKTGDLVYYDTDGYFYVVDRLKDVIIIRGINVYPKIIENVLLSHPSVKEAVVVAKTDLIDGDQPMGVVVTRENVTVTEHELVKFVDEKVDDAMKLVGGVVFVDSIPLTSSEEVSRYLTKMYVREMEQKKLLVNKN